MLKDFYLLSINLISVNVINLKCYKSSHLKKYVPY